MRRNGDQIVFFETKKSRIIYIWPFICTILSIYFFFLDGIIVLISLVASITAAAYWFYNLLLFLTYKVELTKHHVTISRGLFYKSNVENLLLHITGIEIEQGLLASFFNSGHVSIYIAGKKQDVLASIKYPTLFRDHVNKQINYLHNHKNTPYRKKKFKYFAKTESTFVPKAEQEFVAT